MAQGGLLSEAMKARFPRLGSQDGKDPRRVRIAARWFALYSNWTWWAIEGSTVDGGDFQCFGVVSGHEVELGYWGLNELSALKGPGGMPLVERDRWVRSGLTLYDVLVENGQQGLADALVESASERRKQIALEAIPMAGSFSRRTGRPPRMASE